MDGKALGDRRGLLALARACGALLMALTVAILLRVGYLNEIPSHTEDAGRILAGTIDVGATYRLPLGYAGLLAPVMAVLAQPLAVKLVNFAAYCVFLAVAGRWLTAGGGHRPGMGRSTPLTRAALFALLAGALLVHPYIMLSLSRANESIVAGALVMILVAILTRPPTLAAAIGAGLAIGLLLHVRANSASFALPLAVWFVWGGSAGALKQRVVAAVPKGLAALLAAAAVFTGFSLAVTGHPDYRPTNGGYNLFAANNPYSWNEIIRNQNAEYALAPALAERGVPFGVRNDIKESDYVAWAKAWAVEHPGQVVALTGLKAVTFLSPRLANANSPVKVVFQVFAAALFWVSFVWTCLAFHRRRRWADGMLILVGLSYAVPFVLTNADPRMRFPIDMVFYVQLIALAIAWIAPRAAGKFGPALAPVTEPAVMQ